jgi:hypothetical protein
MMRWPIEIRFGDSTPEPPPQPAPSRPPTILEFIGELTKSGKRAFIAVMIPGGIMIIGTACFIASVLAIHFAAKGIRVPLREIWPAGVGSASLVTAVTALVTRRFRKSAKASRDAAANDHTQDGNQ